MPLILFAVSEKEWSRNNFATSVGIDPDSALSTSDSVSRWFSIPTSGGSVPVSPFVGSRSPVTRVDTSGRSAFRYMS